LAAVSRVLIVEPDLILRRRLATAAQAYADVVEYGDFMQARRCLLAGNCQWVITNLRLQAYNGLHLVHLASVSRQPVRFLVYSERRDLALAREAQRAGAFYEWRDCVHLAIGAYLKGTLPDRDRRNPEVPDRRSTFRGGRRCIDDRQSA
jgi:DNA-binding NtrC family response regulator